MADEGVSVYMMPGFASPAADLTHASAGVARKLLEERFVGALVRRKDGGWARAIAVYKASTADAAFQIRVAAKRAGGADATLHSAQALQDKKEDSGVEQIVYGVQRGI